MRTELEKKKVLLLVPTEIGYQYDDTGEGGPHYVEWRGKTASGPTEKEARANLGWMIGGGLIAEECEI
jgi:hypothetical protein